MNVGNAKIVTAENDVGIEGSAQKILGSGEGEAEGEAAFIMVRGERWLEWNSEGWKESVDGSGIRGKARKAPKEKAQKKKAWEIQGQGVGCSERASPRLGKKKGRGGGG